MLLEPWLLWLLIFVKIPMVFLIWFLYRTMKRWDARWEIDGFGDSDGSDGRGGDGGEPRRPFPRGPGGPLRRTRARRARPTPSHRGLACRRPARPAGVAITRSPREARPLRTP